MAPKETGFTLVELAIVLTIIGLLIGGILKGQEMITNARITATIAQIQQYKAATIAFQDAYSTLPGDVPNASTRVPGCNIGCETVVNFYGRQGDNTVGGTMWGGSVLVTGTTTQGNVLAPDVGYEILNYWNELLLAGFIGGVTAKGIQSAIPFAFDTTHPSSPLGGGYMVSSALGTVFYSIPPAGSTPIASGLTLFLTNSPNTQLSALNDPYTNIIRPTEAQRIDQKLDDGLPGTGSVRGGGGEATAGAAGCYVTGQNVYNTTANGKNCKLLISLMSVN